MMVFIERIIMNSVKVSRKELIQYKSAFYLFTCLCLFRFYR